MSIKKEQKIKAQEWVVMFDGQIKKSEKEIDADEHHLKVNNQNSPLWLDLGSIGQIIENDISVEALIVSCWDISLFVAFYIKISLLTCLLMKIDFGPITFSRIASILLILGFFGLLAYNSTL